MPFLIGQPGFEPGTPSPPDLYANQLRYCPSLHAFRRQPEYDSKTVKKSQRSCMACIRHHAHRQVRKRWGAMHTPSTLQHQTGTRNENHLQRQQSAAHTFTQDNLFVIVKRQIKWVYSSSG